MRQPCQNHLFARFLNLPSEEHLIENGVDLLSVSQLSCLSIHPAQLLRETSSSPIFLTPTHTL